MCIDFIRTGMQKRDKEKDSCRGIKQKDCSAGVSAEPRMAGFKHNFLWTSIVWSGYHANKCKCLS